MAIGIVRELVTKLSFVVDTKKLNNFKRIINNIKGSLSSLTKSLSAFAGAASKILLTITGMISSATIFANVLGRSERALEGLSRITGISRNNLEKLRLAFGNVGLSSGTFNSIITRLGKGLSEAKLGYGDLLKFSNELGINLTKSNGEFKKADELLFEFIDYARQINDPALQQLFMKMAFGDLSPEEAISLLSKPSEEFRKAANEAESLLANISSEDRKQLDEFQKNFNELKALIFKWGTEVVLSILPYLNEAISYFVRMGSAVKDLRVYFTELAESLSKMFKPFADFADSLEDKIAPEGSLLRRWINFWKEVGHDYIHPFETVDKISKGLAGVTIFKEQPSQINITNNIQVPPGTTAQQVEFIDDAANQSWDSIGVDIERSLRQSRDNNFQPAY